MNAPDSPSYPMLTRVERCRDLKPCRDTMNDAHGMPPAAIRMMSPDKAFPVMSPEGWQGRGKVRVEVERRLGKNVRNRMAASGVRLDD